MSDLANRVSRRFLAVVNGVGTFKLPADHLLGMAVPNGGSNCTKCAAQSKDKKHCGNPVFQDWRKSLKAEDPTLIPGDPDAYCCDVFSARK